MQRQEGKTSIDTHLSTRSHAGTEQEAHPKGYSAPVMADRGFETDKASCRGVLVRLQVLQSSGLRAQSGPHA